MPGKVKIMKIIEEKNMRDPNGKWLEYEPRPRSNAAAKVTIAKLRRHALKDLSIISHIQYRLQTING